MILLVCHIMWSFDPLFIKILIKTTLTKSFVNRNIFSVESWKNYKLIECPLSSRTVLLDILKRKGEGS